MSSTRRRTTGFVLAGLLVTLLVAGVGSWYASSSPDGLESAAEQAGFADTARDSAAAGSPLADYGVSGIDSDRLSGGLAGVVGVLVTLLGLVAVAVGWGAFRLLARLLPTSRGGVLTAAGVGAFLSVPVAALVFVGLFAVGGVADVPVGAVAAAMGGVHVLIGLGEAAITVAVVGAVLAVRPDLVYGARSLRRSTPLAGRPSSVPAGAR